MESVSSQMGALRAASDASKVCAVQVWDVDLESRVEFQRPLHAAIVQLSIAIFRRVSNARSTICAAY